MLGGDGIGAAFTAMANRHAGAYFVDRILKGATPGDLPVERATKFGMVFNLKIAKVLGTRVGQSGQNASEVVEFTDDRRGSSVAEQLIRNQ